MSVAWIRFCVLPVLAACCFASAADCAPPTVLLNALNHEGGIEPSLRAADLSIEVGGKAVPISSMAIDKNPRRVVLMLDTSGSMAGELERDPWGITLAAAAFAVDTLPANSTAALAVFARKLRHESPEFESREAVGKRVLALKERSPFGQTHLYHSIQQAIDEFTELRLGDVLYLVTDGGDNDVKTTRAEVTRTLIAHGIRIFVFLIEGTRSFRTEEEERGQAEMKAMAESTGGAIITISPAQLAPRQRGALDKLSRQISDQAATFYRLEAGMTPTEKAVHVKVKLVNRETGTQTLVYPHEIMPCEH